MLEQPLILTGFSSIQCFNSPSFPNIVSEAAQDPLPLTVKHMSELQDAMLRHWSPGTSNPYLGNQRIFRGGKYPKHMPLSTYLA